MEGRALEPRDQPGKLGPRSERLQIGVCGRKVPSTFPWYRRVGGPIQSWRVRGPIQSRHFGRAPSLIAIGEAIPPPGISKVAENSPNPDRLS